MTITLDQPLPCCAWRRTWLPPHHWTDPGQRTSTRAQLRPCPQGDSDARSGSIFIVTDSTTIMCMSRTAHKRKAAKVFEIDLSECSSTASMRTMYACVVYFMFSLCNKSRRHATLPLANFAHRPCRRNSHAWRKHAWLTLALMAVSFVLFPYCGYAAQAQRPFIVGISAHPTWKSRNYRTVIDAVQAAGATSIRFIARWPGTRPQSGQFHIPAKLNAAVSYAIHKNLEVLLVLQNPHQRPTTKAARDSFVKFAKQVAQYFDGRVSMYEVWNEWHTRRRTTNGFIPAGTAEKYYLLLKPTYIAIKSVDKTIQVIGGSVTAHSLRTKYFKNLVRTGALKYMDGLSIHPYNYCRKHRSVEAWVNWLTSIEHVLTGKTKQSFPIYITEFGVPTYNGSCGKTQKEQAETAYNYITAASRLPFVRGIWWYTLRDIGGDKKIKNHWFGLSTSGGVNKPAYDAFKRATKYVKGHHDNK